MASFLPSATCLFQNSNFLSLLVFSIAVPDKRGTGKIGRVELGENGREKGRHCLKNGQSGKTEAQIGAMNTARIAAKNV